MANIGSAYRKMTNVNVCVSQTNVYEHVKLYSL